jgi:hypothetical protein
VVVEGAGVHGAAYADEGDAEDAGPCDRLVGGGAQGDRAGGAVGVDDDGGLGARLGPEAGVGVGHALGERVEVGGEGRGGVREHALGAAPDQAVAGGRTDGHRLVGEVRVRWRRCAGAVQAGQ